LVFIYVDEMIENDKELDQM